MPVFTDQTGHRIQLEGVPQRIISLVPSQTELLYDLGLDKEVVGITKFCVHPEQWFRSKSRVGGTKQYKLDRIEQLRPDLILANKEENEEAQIKALMERHPVWVSDIENLEDALDMIRQVGMLTNRQERAASVNREVQRQFADFLTPEKPIKTAYFIWRSPWMVAGKDTFINDMLRRCGFENVFAAQASRYPEISKEELEEKEVDLLLLSSEPYPFKEKHIEELSALCPKATIKLVDGELFSWYGSRLLKAVPYFKALRSAVDSSVGHHNL